MATDNDTAFEMAASSLRFGVGVTREVGMDLKDMGSTHVLVITDPMVRNLPPALAVLESLDESGVRFAVYDRVRVEPTEKSFLDAIAFARAGEYGAFVAAGRRAACYVPRATGVAWRGLGVSLFRLKERVNQCLRGFRLQSV